MASKQDAGAKRKKFYDIECVIDDCAGEDENKHVSEGDEREEDEQREEG